MYTVYVGVQSYFVIIDTETITAAAATNMINRPTATATAPTISRVLDSVSVPLSFGNELDVVIFVRVLLPIGI